MLGHDHAELGKQLVRALGRLCRRAGQQAAEALIRALDDPEAHVTFLDEVVKALGDIDSDALTDWVITRTAKGLNPTRSARFTSISGTSRARGNYDLSSLKHWRSYDPRRARHRSVY